MQKNPKIILIKYIGAKVFLTLQFFNVIEWVSKRMEEKSQWALGNIKFQFINLHLKNTNSEINYCGKTVELTCAVTLILFSCEVFGFHNEFSLFKIDNWKALLLV